ncbi:MAG TPA: hypothetical protein VFG14_02125, partial [Chthoniobacteraceae bacterium]|nr:hypothetical protein [Chthoniobacteraceae bacterium]
MSCDSNHDCQLPRRAAVTRLLVLLLLAATAASARADVPAVVYQKPITITQGGTYSGNFRSDDSNTPAITVSTNDPVEITGCRILSAGIHIRAYGGTQLNVHHNLFTGQPPTGGQQWGRVLDDYHPQTLVFEHNTVDHTGGLLIDHADENTKS